MRIVLICVVFIFGIARSICIASNRYEELWQRLYSLSSESLICSTSTPEDTILYLCEQAATEAKAHLDYSSLFKIRQIAVNSYCLKGNFGLAIDKASQMYEEAKVQKSDLGKALALQALANTYMYSGRYELADYTYSEAFSILNTVSDDQVRLRLLLQHIHLLTLVSETDKVAVRLKQAEKIISRLQTVEIENYRFFLYSYRILYQFRKGESEKALESIKQIKHFNVSERLSKPWITLLLSNYYLSKRDFDNALFYADSAFTEARKDKSSSQLLNAMTNKAWILEVKQDFKEAYLIYAEINRWNDSLNINRYSYQINKLHMNYQIDQMQLRRIAEYNKVLAWTIAFCLLTVLTCIVAIMIIKRKNKRLKQARTRLTEESKNASRSIQSKSLFFSNMNHEIRTPLNAIVGFSEVLATCTEIDQETKIQCGNSIQQNADLLLKLINDVTNMVEADENEMNFIIKPADLVAICRNVISTVNKVKQNPIEIYFICPFNQFVAQTDASRLQQVLINLLINATKFTQEGNISLLLDINKEKNEVVFTVEDTGCGVPPENQEQIFDRFEKLHESKQGIGLGLSICKLIITHLGGRIWIDPEYHIGARFIFTLPLRTDIKNEKKQ